MAHLLARQVVGRDQGGDGRAGQEEQREVVGVGIHGEEAMEDGLVGRPRCQLSDRDPGGEHEGDERDPAHVEALLIRREGGGDQGQEEPEDHQHQQGQDLNELVEIK
ncbi:hypothetical protein D3C87_1081590 [compost metagenome]